MWNFRPQSSNRWPPSLAVLRTQHFLKTDWRKVGDSALLRKNRTVIRTLSRIQQPKLLISNFFIIIYLLIYLVIYCSHKDEFHKVQMASFLMSAKLSLLLSTGTTVDVQTMSYFLCFWRFLFLFQCVIYLFFKKTVSIPTTWSLLHNSLWYGSHKLHVELLHGYFTNSKNASHLYTFFF